MYLSNILLKTKREFLQIFFVWVIKIIAAISLGLIYQTYYSGGDTFSLFEDGKQLYNIAKNEFHIYIDIVISTLLGKKSPHNYLLASSNPRAVIMAIYNSLLIVLVGKNYWLVSVFAASLHFVVTIGLVKQLKEQFSLSTRKLCISFFFFPSILFWSSGLLKENLLTSGLYLCIILYFKIHDSNLKFLNRLFYSISLLLLLYLLFRLKYYYIAVFTPLLCAHYISSKSHDFFRSWLSIKLVRYAQALSLILVFSSLILLATFTHPNLNVDFILQAVVQNNLKMASETQDQSNLIEYNELDATPMSFLKNMPYVAYQGLVRPYIWERGNIFKKVVALENIFIILMLIYALYRVYFNNNMKGSYFLEVISILLYSLIMLVLLSMATPNLGTLSRYKVGFLPFLILIIWPSNLKINPRNWS